MKPMRAKLFIAGDPVGWKRTRHKGKQHYTDPRVRGWRQTVQFLARAWRAENSVPLLDGAFGVSLEFRLGRPRSHYTTRRRALTKSAPRLHTHKPDADNLAKLMLDALQDVLWGDDKFAVTLMASKLWVSEKEAGVSVCYWPIEEAGEETTWVTTRLAVRGR